MCTRAMKGDSTARDPVSQQPVGIDVAPEETGILASMPVL